MPQTEAEHLENQSLDYDENEKPQSDAEVSDALLVVWPPPRLLLWCRAPVISITRCCCKWAPCCLLLAVDFRAVRMPYWEK